MSSLILIALLAAGPVPARRPDTAGAVVAAAEAAAEPWLTLVDQQHYGRSWDSTAAPFRSAVSKAKWEQAVQQARAPFEAFGGRKLRSATYATTLPNAPPGDYLAGVRLLRQA